MITEAMRLSGYLPKNYSISFLATRSGAEVDLIVERPGNRPVFIEINSSERIQDRHLTHLKSMLADFEDAEGYWFCNERVSRRGGKITVIPWQQGLREIGLGVIS